MAESRHLHISIGKYNCCNLSRLLSLLMNGFTFTHLFLPALKEQLGISCRTLFGLEASQMSFLFLLVYVAAAGGLLPLLESSPGSAQELKVKVTCLFHRPKQSLVPLSWVHLHLGALLFSYVATIEVAKDLFKCYLFKNYAHQNRAIAWTSEIQMSQLEYGVRVWILLQNKPLGRS